jgi:hypothetical protein
MIVSLHPNPLPEGEGDVERATRDFHRNISTLGNSPEESLSFVTFPARSNPSR